MASVKKFTDGAVVNQLRHNNREIKNDKNNDIDPHRTPQNYSLTPVREISDYKYYKNRKEELYCYNRGDVKTMAGWVVTAPKELTTKEQEKAFFESTYEFLENRYGKENVIQATVHYDEGKMEKVQDRWGEYVKDENGEIKTELVLGQPHLHFDFIPVAPDRNPKHIQEEKICANDVLTPVELKRFHTDLQNHLKANNIQGEVLTGTTKANGRNYTVEELKENYEKNKELERLRRIEEKYNMEHSQTVERKGRW
ncbi:MAG: plasmid recombination protein [Clostridium sp.]